MAAIFSATESFLGAVSSVVLEVEVETEAGVSVPVTELNSVFFVSESGRPSESFAGGATVDDAADVEAEVNDAAFMATIFSVTESLLGAVVSWTALEVEVAAEDEVLTELPPSFVAISAFSLVISLDILSSLVNVLVSVFVVSDVDTPSESADKGVTADETACVEPEVGIATTDDVTVPALLAFIKAILSATLKDFRLGVAVLVEVVEDGSPVASVEASDFVGASEMSCFKCLASTPVCSFGFSGCIFLGATAGGDDTGADKDDVEDCALLAFIRAILSAILNDCRLFALPPAPAPPLSPALSSVTSALIFMIGGVVLLTDSCGFAFNAAIRSLIEDIGSKIFLCLPQSLGPVVEL